MLRAAPTGGRAVGGFEGGTPVSAPVLELLPPTRLRMAALWEDREPPPPPPDMARAPEGALFLAVLQEGEGEGRGSGMKEGGEGEKG